MATISSTDSSNRHWNSTRSDVLISLIAAGRAAINSSTATTQRTDELPPLCRVSTAPTCWGLQRVAVPDKLRHDSDNTQRGHETRLNEDSAVRKDHFDVG